MARIQLEDTPIFTQLTKEYVAKEAYDRFFNETGPFPESSTND